MALSLVAIVCIMAAGVTGWIRQGMQYDPFTKVTQPVKFCTITALESAIAIGQQYQ